MKSPPQHGTQQSYSQVLTFPDPSPDCNYNRTVYLEVSQRMLPHLLKRENQCVNRCYYYHNFIERQSLTGISEFEGNNYRDMLLQLLGWWSLRKSRDRPSKRLSKGKMLLSHVFSAIAASISSQVRLPPLAALMMMHTSLISLAFQSSSCLKSVASCEAYQIVHNLWL